MTTVETVLQKEKLDALAQRLSLPAFDLLLIGDGAGTTIEKPCGFACVAYSPGSKPILHSGSFTNGTNNYAELMPFVHALWYDCYMQDSVLSHKRSVEIVSDSELTVRQGNRIYTRNANKLLWGAIDKLENMGYAIHWNHVLRNTNEVNTLCDKIAKEEKQKRA